MGVLKVYDGTAWRKVGCGGTSDATVTDDFARADGALGTSASGHVWQGAAGKPVISGGRMVKGTGGADAAYVEVGAATAWTWSGTVVPVGTGRGFLDILLGYTDNSDYWLIEVSYNLGSQFRIGFADSSNLGSATNVGFSPVTGRPFIIEASGQVVGGSTYLEATLTDTVTLATVTRSTTLSGVKSGPRMGAFMDIVAGTNDLQVEELTMTAASGTVGRLKLWDGTQWVRERCDDEPGILITPLRWTFESANDWTVLSGNATLTLTGTTAAEGSQSLGIDRTSGSASVVIRSPFMAAAEGQQWRGLTSVNCGTNPTFSVRPDVLFYDNTQTLLTGAAGGFNPSPAGTWIRTRTVTAAAPAGTAYVAIRYTIDAGGAGSRQYLDRVLLGLAGTYATEGMFEFGVDVAAAEWDDLTPVDSGVLDAHPLKLWDGTAWVTVACMVPV